MMPNNRNMHGYMMCWCFLAFAPALGKADIVTFEAADFGLVPTFSDVQTFGFSINLAVTVNAGTAYSDPELNGVDYHVFGTLGPVVNGIV